MSLNDFSLVIGTGISLSKPSSTCCGLSSCHFLSCCLLTSFTPANRILPGWDTAVHHRVCVCVRLCGFLCCVEVLVSKSALDSMSYLAHESECVCVSPLLNCASSGLDLSSVITVRHSQLRQLLCKPQQWCIDPFKSKTRKPTYLTEPIVALVFHLGSVQNTVQATLDFLGQYIDPIYTLF